MPKLDHFVGGNVITVTPGIKEASLINSKLKSIGINDVQLLFDDGILPKGMWAVCQTEKKTNILLMPGSYNESGIKPYILWWCKDEQAQFRIPNDNDLMDIITVVKRAPDIWAQGEKRADKFDEVDAKKDQAHRQRFKDRIHDIAPAMKKALKEGNL